MAKDIISRIEDSIKKNWDLDALTDYKGCTLQSLAIRFRFVDATAQTGVWLSLQP